MPKQGLKEDIFLCLNKDFGMLFSQNLTSKQEFV